MKKKLTAALTAAITTAAISLPVYAEHKTVQMTVAPENMLNVQVVDPDGNPVEGVEVTMTNSSGTKVARWNTGDIYNYYRSNSGIDLYSKLPDSNCHFTEPIETFTSLAAPYTVADLNGYTDNSFSSGEFEDDVWFTSGQKRTLTLLAYDPDLAADTSLAANQLGIYRSGGWNNRSTSTYFQLDNTVFQINHVSNESGGLSGGFEGLPALDVSQNNIGILATHSLTDTDFEKMYFGVEYSELTAADTFSDAFSFDPDAREYIKYRVHITELDWVHDSFDAWDNASGTFSADGHIYTLAQDLDSTAGLDYTTSTLQIVSGMMVSAPIPDENGYIEFYVDKATRRFSAYVAGAWKKYDSASSWDCGYLEDYALNELAGTHYSLEVSAVTLPETGDTLIDVPAGEYTLSITDNVPARLLAPGSVSVNVAASQEVQNVTIVLDALCTKGDVNEDGVADISDATLALTHYARTAASLDSGLSDVQISAADVDEDGVITLSDATAILTYYAQYAAGLNPGWN
ncbi:MAG: hypothetical protein IJ496_00620 [Ruminococcus sp.]|nr:hypothetical protein [Ruminococcus sp.]